MHRVHNYTTNKRFVSISMCIACADVRVLCSPLHCIVLCIVYCCIQFSQSERKKSTNQITLKLQPYNSWLIRMQIIIKLAAWNVKCISCLFFFNVLSRLAICCCCRRRFNVDKARKEDAWLCSVRCLEGKFPLIFMQMGRRYTFGTLLANEILYEWLC